MSITTIYKVNPESSFALCDLSGQFTTVSVVQDIVILPILNGVQGDILLNTAYPNQESGMKL